MSGIDFNIDRITLNSQTSRICIVFHIVAYPEHTIFSRSWNLAVSINMKVKQAKCGIMVK